MSPDASDQVESAKRVIDDNRYLTLGTADGQGNPWVSPVWYATNGYTEFLWLSSADARHSKNIATRSRVALVIFDSRSAPTDARALYIDGHANEVKKRELERAQGVFSAASLAEGLPTRKVEDFLPPGRMRLYRAEARETFVLENDERIRIAL